MLVGIPFFQKIVMVILPVKSGLYLSSRTARSFSRS
jgi:hypothetical protein